MKLRLRNLETKETLRLEIPSSPCTLQQLQQTLSQSISLLPPPSSSSSYSLHFSLNRKDALHASSPHDSLHSLGITSGDLIYFSLNPSAFSPPPQIPNSNPKSESDIFQESQVLDLDYPNQETPVQGLIDRTNLDSNIQIQGSEETPVQDLAVQQNMVDTNQETEDIQDLSGTETMDIDDGTMDVAGNKLSEPCFLRRVLREELGDDGSNHKLLVVAVHSVLLESGFVGFDSVSGLRADRFHLPDEWPSTAFTVSLWYTLPELLGKETESVVLKFRTLGHFVNVYGSLAKGGSSLYRVCLDEDRFVPTIDAVWANCDKNDKIDGSSSLSPEDEVFEFWKIVKDGLALPLLIDLCDRTGLVLPPCLMRLPTELKVKILESLPAVDVAKMGCVCSEMRYLSSNNDLWKQKFAEEFGGEMGVQGMIPWKHKFTYSWECRKKRKRVMSRQWQERVGRPFYFPIRRDPLGWAGWPVIGGDYDRLPGLGIPSLIGQPGRAFPRRNFLPPCNLGGLNI